VGVLLQLCGGVGAVVVVVVVVWWWWCGCCWWWCCRWCCRCGWCWWWCAVVDGAVAAAVVVDVGDARGVVAGV